MKKTTLFSLALAAGLALSPVLADAQSKVTLTTANEVGSEFSFVTNAGTLSVDWGDGTPVEVTATGEAIKGTLKGQTVTITSDNLTFLDCSSCKLTDLNLSALDLNVLNCSDNQLTSLSLSTATRLQDVDCSSNKLKSLSLTRVTGLISLNCADNELSLLSLSDQKDLKYLICSDNSLTSLSLSNASSLETLWCQDNSLKSLNLAANTQLQSLVCDNNELTNITVTNCTKIIDFWCDNNQLTSLEIYKNQDLETLSCSNNALSSLNIAAASPSKPTVAFYCDGNNLTFASLHTADYVENEDNMIYSPQNPFSLSATQVTVGENFFLPEMDKNVDGESVSPKYTWLNGEEELVKGSREDYTARSNMFIFNKPFESIYCKVTSSKYPDLTLTSTPLTVVEKGTGIQDIMAAYGFSYITNNGSITMKSGKPYQVNIYSVDGKQVWSGTVMNEERVNLGHGIFLVNGVKISL